MTFGEALELCKKGARIYREGWNGKGQYVELATNISYRNPQGEQINADHKSIGNKALAFVGTSGVQLGWLASQADMLADDWNAYKPEIIKTKIQIESIFKRAEECCKNDKLDCENCPYDSCTERCQQLIMEDALTLIRLWEENQEGGKQ